MKCNETFATVYEEVHVSSSRTCILEVKHETTFSPPAPAPKSLEKWFGRPQLNNCLTVQQQFILVFLCSITPVVIFYDYIHYDLVTAS